MCLECGKHNTENIWGKRPLTWTRRANIPKKQIRFYQRTESTMNSEKWRLDA
jgi:hypothetical protein